MSEFIGTKLTMNLGERSYDIIVKSGSLENLYQFARLDRRVAVVTDSGVPAQYAQMVADQCKDAHIITVPQGEASKSFKILESVLKQMLEFGMGRGDLVIAVGGGVVGDLAGFAASIYMRGIDFINCPTTTLSMIDSSIGGKTAVDLGDTKNIVGAFWQPSLVLCDTACLDTLPKATFRDGCAEVIKYGILFDRDFFDYLSKTGMEFDREYVIERCVAMKRDVVDRDEFDVGARKLLNLGHTIGHSVEANSRFTLSHGQSVAIGTAIVARAAAAKGILSREDCGRILKTLRAYGLPVETGDDPEILAEIALSDKKRSGGTLDLIVPEAIGSCKVLPVPVSDVLAWIQEGM